MLEEPSWLICRCASLLGGPGHRGWLLLLGLHVALLLHLQACSPDIGELEVRNDALAALIGVRRSNVRPDMSLHVA